MLKKIASYTAAAVIMSAALTSCGSTVQLGNTSEAPTSAAVTATAEENRAANQVEAVEKVITQAQAEEPVTEPFHLDVSVPDNFQIPASFMIDGFQTVLQNPELPTGCEVTSLTQTLNYLGFNIDKLTLADNFMPMDFHALVVMENLPAKHRAIITAEMTILLVPVRFFSNPALKRRSANIAMLIEIIMCFFRSKASEPPIASICTIINGTKNFMVFRSKRFLITIIVRSPLSVFTAQFYYALNCDSIFIVPSCHSACSCCVKIIL